jgi:hypothetical protein
MRSRNEVHKAIFFLLGENTSIWALSAAGIAFFSRACSDHLSTLVAYASQRRLSPFSHPQSPEAERKSEIILPWDVHGSRLVIKSEVSFMIVVERAFGGNCLSKLGVKLTPTVPYSW